MANEVEIIVRARDQSAPGIDAAKARLRELADSARKVPNDLKIKAEADVAKAEAEIARLEDKWARNDVAKFKVQADTEAAEARLEKLRLEAERATGERKIKVKAEIAEAEAKLAALGAKMRHLDADTAATTAKIELLQHKLANVGNDGVSSLDKLQKKLNDLRDKGFSPLITAALALGPALLPVAAQAVTIVGSLANSLASAGAAAGVFGAVVKSTFGDVTTADGKTDHLREKIRLLNREIQLAPAGSKLQTKAMEEQAKATLELNARLSLLPPTTRAAVVSFEAMKSSWEDFKDKNKGEAFSFLTRAFNVVKEVIPKLQPLFDAGAAAANKLLNVFERKVRDGGVERLIKYLADHAKGALSDTIGIFTNLARALGNFVKATDDGGGALHWVEQMTAKLADFTKSQAFMNFLDWVHSNGAQVGEALIHIAQAAVKIVAAIAPLSPISLALASGLAGIIAAIPVPVLTGIIGAFIAWSVAVKAIAAAEYIWATANGETTLSLVALKIAQTGAAIASSILTAAQWALNVALDANPIGLVIIAIAALAAGIIYAYTHSETFRHIVQAAGRAAVIAFRAVLSAVSAVVNWIRGHWPLLLVILTGPIGAAVVLIIRHWSRIVGVVHAAWGVIMRLGSSMWGGLTHGVAAAVAFAAGKIDWLVGKIHAAQNAANSLADSATSNLPGGSSGIPASGIRGAVMGATPLGLLGSVAGWLSGTGHATGGPASGWTVVGERGRELVRLPSGSSVVPNGQSESMLTGGTGSGGRIVLEINSGGSAMDDLLVQILRKAVRTRGGNVQLALGQ